MRILVVDQENFGLDFVLRCTAAGHDVKWFRWHRRPIKNGDGFGLQYVERWQEHMKWADLVMTTGNCRYMKELDDWRQFGAPVFGPSWRSAQLEIQRAEGMKLFEQKGMNVAPYQQFPTLEAAKKHVLKTDQNYAFKTLGDEENKALTFVSKTPAQMAEWLDRKIRAGMSLKGPCMLQEKIEFVAEVGVAGWMGPEGFLPDKWEIAFEHKKLMPGGFGQNTGEMGTVCQYVGDDDPLVPVLRSVEDDLRGRGHLGDININGGVDADGDFWPFEFTARLGWPDFFIRMSMHKGDPAEWMRALLKGEDKLRVSRDPCIGVVCARCPFPYGDGKPEEVEGHPIYGLEKVWDDAHPVDLMMAKGYDMVGNSVATGNVYRTTGTYVLVATGSGSTVTKARESVYDTVGQIVLSDMIARDDIGETVIDSLPKLHKLGYCREINA